MKLILKGIILTAAVVLLLKSYTPFLDTQNELIDQQAPEFTLSTTSGREMSMTQFRNDQPAMIFFWATWCPHCRTQLQELTRYHESIDQKGIKIILVDSGESAQKVNSYTAANKISLEVFLDQDTKVSRDYKVSGVPTFFFVNKEGVVVAVEHFLPDHYEEILL